MMTDSQSPFTTLCRAMVQELMAGYDRGHQSTKKQGVKDGHPHTGDKTVPGLIAKHGYPVETHTVTTSDGYMLDIHRIPHGSSGPGKRPRIPVLIQHGLLCSSADWLVSGPGKALGFILADEGYDVWLGNVRGNRYGRRHRTLSPQDDAFWSFRYRNAGVGSVSYRSL
ncbi:unnamed protein product [Darwinula stevensoni]|uniref:Partial AB-hydrolase lipase domain-containing protein n=1 Tax=Darwinula stevensoni TaxID=69355 RepID=A0A7R9FU19_9CRUS|nr:unnamed protein product [Darwinula stevensoni]CAG0907624.1 unnamed protein product [Darwinula stevensoni]